MDPIQIFANIDFLISGLYPTAFFLWKKYLVLMPEVDCSRDERMVR